MKPLIEELDSLLMDWEAGTLDDVGVGRVREILKTNAEARSHFANTQVLTAALQLESGAGLSVGTTEGETVLLETDGTGTQTGSNAPRWVSVAVVAASLLACGLVGRSLLTSSPNGKPNEVATVERPRGAVEATARGVALLTRLVNVSWSDEQTDFDVGDALSPGRISLKSGFAQIEFLCGATVVLEGPVELELTSSTHARIHHGRLRANVPPAAIGFTIEAADIKVVDLGTEFGMSVSDTGSDVHVFDGEVELHAAGLDDTQAEKKMLGAGQAISHSADGDYTPSQSDAEEFVGIERLESQAADQVKQRLENWRRSSQELRKDPRLIAYYSFDDIDGWQRRLKSDIPDTTRLDGAIVGAARLDGRWPGKSALEFKRPSDRVRVDIPGEYGSLTFACWAKIDSLDRWYNSLFLTDGYEQGEPHWQILDTGQLFFSARFTKEKGKGPSHQPILSPSFWNPSLSGKWIHLATTFDVSDNEVSHYLNGRLLSSELIPGKLAVKTTRIGKASIGNWASPIRPDAHYAIRNLNGSIDELAIFSVALTSDEVEKLYEVGKP